MILILFVLFNLVISSRPTIIAYFAFFDDAYNSTMNVSNKIPWAIFDRIIISFAILDGRGNLTNEHPSDNAKIRHIQALYKKSRPDGQIYISNYGDDTYRYLYAANHSDVFSASVLRYLKRYNMNGFDLDWETGMINRYSSELVTLITSCDQVFNTKYKITHAIWPYVHDPGTVGLLADIVDEINIMTYQYDMNSIEALIKQYNGKGFPYEKMVLGIETESERETKGTIADKIRLINKYNMSGLFLWRLDNDGIVRDDNDTIVGPPTFRTTWMLYDVLHRL